MSRSFTLAHLSDLHLTPVQGFHLRYWNVKRAMGYLNWRRSRSKTHSLAIADALIADARAHGAGHFAITGDLSNIGLPAEHDAAYEWLRTVGPPELVSVVPGNHDIYSARMHGTAQIASWSEYHASCDQGRRLVPPQAGAFPYMRLAGPLALIGINSAAPRAPFVAAGRVGADQLRHLSSILEQAEKAGHVRVVMIHHPPLPGQAPRLRALDDAGDLHDILSAHGAELVIHGHNHRDSLIWLEGRKKSVPIVGVASGSAVRRHGHEPLASYKIYRFSSAHEGVRIEMHTRGITSAGGKVEDLSQVVLSPR